MRAAIAAATLKKRGEVIGHRCNALLGLEYRLPSMFENLNGGADAHRHHEGDDENRNGAAQERLSAEQAPIGRIGD
jgi:hypothetical protein